MRAETDQRCVTSTPGTPIAIVIDVVNSGDLIDGVTTRLIGLPDATSHSEPALLPLFPGASGQITVVIDVPTSQAAGRHPVTIEVVSAVTGTPTQYVDVEIEVEARPSVRVTREPAVIRARRHGRFVLALENNGNVALDTVLAATTPERVTATFTPAAVRVEPGSVQAVLVRVTGPRMFTGSEVDRGVGIAVAARPATVLADAPESTDDLTDSTTLTLKQRPVISRGFLTFLILAAIVAIWAAIFLLGLTQVFKGDPLTKTAPVSFYANTDAAAADGGKDGADGKGGADGAPAGSTPKTGLLAPGVGGTIEGVVTAVSNSSPVGRITVTAWRMGRDGPVPVSSAATQSDGSYTLAGLFPTTYWLEFAADGYRSRWYPGKPSRPSTGSATTAAATGDSTGDAESSDGDRLHLTLAASSGISVGAQSKTAGTNVVMRGKPATISGRVDPGDAITVPTTTVTATMIDGGKQSGPATTVTTDASGAYVLSALKAPGTYQLAFAADGYEVTTQLETVAGGESRREPTIQLGSRDGTLTGTVYDGTQKAGKELGGVTVTTTVAGSPVTLITPTVGAVGSFTFDNLPTPGTYLVTFTSPGHGSTVRIVELDAGGNATANTVMSAGTGSVSGHLLDPSGKGIGGATVTIGGLKSSTAMPTTTTLTSGDVGAYSVTGLASPGNYTLTFTVAGSDPVTIPVTLSGDAPLSNVTATLAGDKVRLYGLASTPSGAPLVGAKITVSDGVHVWTTTSTDSGGSLPSAIRSTGGYLFPAITQGTYSVTITASGYAQQTTRLEITSAGSRRLDLAVLGGSS
jgi:hypothetical protein